MTRLFGAFAPLLLLAVAACAPAGPPPMVSGPPAPAFCNAQCRDFPAQRAEPFLPSSPQLCCVETTPKVVERIIEYRYAPAPRRAARHAARPPCVQPCVPLPQPCPSVGGCLTGPSPQWKPTIDCRAAGGVRTINPQTGAPSCFVPSKKGAGREI